MTTKKESRFLSALAQFEKCLETPVVPGELPTWLQAAQKSCEEVGQLLGHEVNERHDELFQTILQEDAELTQKVEELKTKDSDLLLQYEAVQSKLDQLCGISDQLEPHEAKFDEHVEDSTDQALSFVLEARKQDTAITTWYMEAFNRDRGIAD